jgi:hypothetical protein
MKRALLGLMCLLLLAATALPAAAQGRRDRYYRGGEYGRSYGSSRYGYNGYRGNDGRSYWDRHRDKATVAIGTGAGAAIGAIAGGGRGAVVGALIGAGTSALYTYNRRDRYYGNNRYYGRSRGRFYR